MISPKVTAYQPDDLAVWPLIGPILASRAVAKELGGQPFADDAVAWFVAAHRGKVAGVLCLKLVADAYWLDCDYVVPELRGQGVHIALSAARSRHLETLDAKPLKVVVRKARWKKHYTTRPGWAVEQKEDAK